MWLALLLSCAPAKKAPSPEDTGEVADTAPPEDTAGSADSADTAPVTPTDYDQDGFGSDPEAGPSDCDDLDPTAYPGAAEVWDEVDNDCDGVVDADGAYSGAMILHATAIFEGDPYSFSLSCPAEMERYAGLFDLAVSCAPDAGDPMAVKLLGTSLRIEIAGEAVEGASWDGRVDVVSAGGDTDWDTYADGELAWSALDAVEVAAQRSTVSLALQGQGALVRDPAGR